MFSQFPGNGMGEGQGEGDRPEEKTDTGDYKSKVGGKVRKGEAVRVGDANGPNVAGLSQEDVKQEVLSNLRKQEDPLVNQRLPRVEREHAKEYFERFRKGGG